jgi:hypothetical protein
VAGHFDNNKQQQQQRTGREFIHPINVVLLRKEQQGTTTNQYALIY